jgi:ABC-type polysaccharide/polyol phosphate export permease
VSEAAAVARIEPALADAGEPARSLARDLRESIRHPGFWAFSSWLDIVVRYRQSRLGLFWLIAPAIVYIWGMGMFFSGVGGTPLADFAAYVAVGWLVFRLVQSVVIESATAMTQSASFILDGHLRLTDFVLQVAAKAMLYFLLSLPVAAPALVLYPQVQGWGLVLALVTFPIVLLNVLWMGVLLSLLGARFRDLGQLVSNLFMFGFLLTPIIWHASTMPAGSLRGTVMRANPLYHLVELVRGPILSEPVGSLTYWYVGLMTVFGWLAAALVYRRYARFVSIWL